jgi:aminoglycoside phosphotransferase (APT) family kinase protein
MTTTQDPATTTAPTALGPELLRWIETTAGGRVTRADRVPGGGRHEAWLVDVELPDGAVLDLFFRYNRTDPGATGEQHTIHREAQFYLALQDSPVPVPRILGVHPVEQAVLSSRVPGETWFSRLEDEEQRLSVAREFMGHLAALHEVDPHRVQLPDAHADADLRDVVRAEIDTWEALYRHGEYRPEPLIEFGLDWLRRNVPDVDGPVVVVQGDTGPGNFLYRDGHVTAVLDWELAHLGDPHDDLGWLSLRAVQEPFTNLADRLADYAEASGRTLDLGRIRYYRVFAELRVVILGNRRNQAESLLGEVGNGLIYGALHRRLYVEALAEVMGIELEQPEPLSAEPSERDWLYEAALAQLREIIVPRSTDPFVVLRSKGLARLLKYLRSADQLAPLADEQELADLAGLLGSRPGSVQAGREELAAAVQEPGRLSDADVLRVFGRRVARETQVLRPSMGVLADRHFDPLER